jgi:hypothetical protein
MKNACVSISRPQSSRGDTSIAITIEDADSHLTVLRVNLSLENFAACITGQACMPAKVERWIGANAHNVGKTLEVRDLKLAGRAPWKDSDASRWVLSHPDLVLADGWELYNDGVGTQQHGDVHRVTLCRYVEKPS